LRMGRIIGAAVANLEKTYVRAVNQVLRYDIGGSCKTPWSTAPCRFRILRITISRQLRLSSPPMVKYV
jgi:hypothetical protein